MQKKHLYTFCRCRFILFLGFILLIFNSADAQQNGMISGKITDTNGKALPGATVKITGSNRWFMANNTGDYTFQLPAGVYTVEASLISYLPGKKTNVLVKASTTTQVNFTLRENANELNEVVVTALGITRAEKSLGYATSVIKGEELTEALSNNWTDALSGKVAGLNLIRSNAGPAGSNKIVLRGENNLSGDNDALVVVDGVIINGGSGRATGNGGAYLSADDNSVDYGTNLNDINPEDIENVTVLKGPGAAALYGSRGANGALIITTKSGYTKQKGIGITLNSNTAFETINRMPDLQYEYGQGNDGADYYSYGNTEDGVSTRSTTKAFGPKFNGQSFFQYDPVTHSAGAVRTPWVPYEHSGMDDFFVTGKTFTNSITLNGGTEKTSARFSATNVNNQWIAPNTGYGRTTIAMSVNSKPTKNLQISSKINYTNKSSDNLPSSGYNNQTLMYGYIFWLPSASIDWLKDYWLPGQTNIAQNQPLINTYDNPYLISYEMLNKLTRNALTGNVSATYNLTKDLNVMVRTSMDLSYDQRSQQKPFNTQKFQKGMFRTQDIFSQEITSDFLLTYKKKINTDFDISATAGGSMLRNNYNKNELRADSLLYPGIFTMGNSAGPLASYPNRSKYATNSLYGLLTAAYKDFAFIDFTIRNDWSSVLATPLSTANVSFAYPSVNGSLILSELFKLPKAINYAKIRASYADVGSGQFTPYKTAYAFLSDPLYPGGALYNPTTLANINLKPLFTASYEVGAEMKFLDSRLGFDLALYKGNTRNQILTSTVDKSSGEGAIIVNAGMVRNKGIELTLNGTPFRNNRGFTWNVNTTFSANRNTIVALTDGLDQLILQTGPGGSGAVIAKVGGSMGDLYGRGYQRSPDGQIIYENGYPLLSSDLLYLGNTMPKWKASISNQFSYQRFTFSFLIDAQYGSVAYSLTQGKMAVQGKTKSTLPGRYNGIIGNGVVKNADGTFSPNTVIVDDMSTYYDAHFGTNNVEGSTFSTDFLKLREARLDYSFNPKLLNKWGIQKAMIGIYGRDLLVFSKWPGFDPEFGTLNGSEINRGFEIGQFPSTRTMGLNLTLGF